MKVRYKLLTYILVYSSLVLIFLVLTFSHFSLRHRRNEVYDNMETNLTIMTDIIEHEFHHYITLSESIISNQTIPSSIEESNAVYDAYDVQTRIDTIDSLNQSWIDAEDDSVFIDEILSNDLSILLSNIVGSDVDYFGEIFVTNKYGVMIGSSGRLSTMAHGSKYWWVGAYNDGDYRIFLDDRGYDESVGAIVVVVVLPILNQEEDFIGIIKVNIRLDEMLDEHVTSLNTLAGSGEYLIVRQDGNILSKEGIEPLSTTLNEELMNHITESFYTGIVKLDNEDYYFGTMDTTLDFHGKDFYFGGKGSIDDGVGSGDVWKVLYTSKTTILNTATNQTITLTIYIGIGIILVGIIMGTLFGRRITYRLVSLQKKTNELSLGNYDTRIQSKSKDEIGVLIRNFNDLALKLKTTTTSIENYEEELIRRKELEEKLLIMSRYDELTNILNRRALNENIVRYLSISKRNNTSIGLIIFDIDDFKVINDNFGHQNGDKVLIALAKHVNKILREGDIFCRWGGEEFVVLVPNATPSSIEYVSNKILKEVRKVKVTDLPNLTISIGATISSKEDTIDSILKRSDDALYHAKSNGKDQIHFAFKE